MEASTVSAPTTVEEVEALVKRFYSPVRPAPSLVAQLDVQLKQVQLSPGGWQIADVLLGNQDPNVRFFAALTFQVKLNNDGSRLDATTAQSVLMRLLAWTAQLTRAGEGSLVLKKLCGCLTTYFVRSSVPWSRPLLQLGASLHHGDAVSGEQLSQAHDALLQVLPRLSDSQLIPLLWAAGWLATDAAKLDSTTPASAQIHKQMEEIAGDVSKLIAHALRQPLSQQTGAVRTACLTCFLHWVNYAQPMWTNNEQALGHLRGLVIETVPLLTDEELQNEAMDVFRDILEGYTSFFKPAQMELLAAIINRHARPRMLQGLQDREPEVIPVAQLVIAYGIANIQQIVEQPTNEYGSKAIVQLLLAIMEAPGYPGDDDEVSIHSIEFWNTYVEYVNEAMYSRSPDDPKPAWLEHDKEVCMQLSILLWSKMRTPTPEIADTWTSDESEGFKEFRMDASDLMLSIFVRLGNDMLQRFITLALSSLADKNWQDLEAALFAINTLSDNVLEDQSTERLLVQIFGSSLFRDIADFELQIPSHVRRTAIDTLGTYGQYIERHAEFLPDTLRFLFASLETVGLSASAAKSIESLCSTCRGSLTGELNGFLAQYNHFAQSETSEPYTNEKVIGAIAAIVQSVSPESAKAEPLSALLDIVDGIVAHAKELAHHGDTELAQTIGVSGLECLHRIGKGLQIPEDVPIDLYEDNPKPTDATNFWNTEPGQAIQMRIISTCYNVLQFLPRSGEAVDSVCNVLKAGFAETEPGPFVFPPAMSVGFLEQCSINTPHLESVLAMIATMIVQYSRSDQQRIDNEIDRIYRKTVSILHAIGEPSQDPSIAQCCLDIFNRMVGRYTNVFLDTASTGELVQPILDFAIKSIDGADLMPKRAAADFWRRIVQPVDTQDETLRSRMQQVVAAYGPTLCQALMNQITGRGQRSELDQLAEPLKALVANNPNTKSWLEAALFSESLPPLANPSVDDAEKRKFVQMVLALRGDSRKTRDVVKNFYASCRGTVPNYR